MVKSVGHESSEKGALTITLLVWHMERQAGSPPAHVNCILDIFQPFAVCTVQGREKRLDLDGMGPDTGTWVLGIDSFRTAIQRLFGT